MQNQKIIHIIFGTILIIIFGSGIFFTINPKEQLKKIKNYQRQSDVTELIDLMDLYAKENNDEFIKQIYETPTLMGSSKGQVNICELLIPKYTTSLPFDQNMEGTYYKNCKDHNLGYTIAKDQNNKIIISAPNGN
ncbi:hypothetical protein A2483_03385 [Candidatus Peregrinibacteria bacterium RIFOXYC2_FULL_33_13]|nr:MAG: hypothetical protein UR27_C0003G0070 [Candidatus Peregrinibacteria bacterium GW2011_GWA2_33_10]KKP40796.1 MAG: hypothetical protein UR30_C0004G0054 [Candidatus Peregrinibacteria bacterium GW2011_GWC2_33_13]OGJ48043.1 MAG: hypothetical protein A2229_03345 [Candidatus Peregrinibacteria bacterium RIFOXYA2_FULL_33_7]OGJ57014.1 MAG: hypothetical protein A2483_03385 [Candidatus Peregrinibacteria bacterium RIFOXYC2_FULL_33_13]